MAEAVSVTRQQPITANTSTATSSSNIATSSAVAPAPFTIVSSREKVRYMNAMLFGEYGAGKTWLGASSVLVPDMRDVLYLSIEAGAMTLDAFLPHEIDEIELTSFSQIARIVEYLTLHCRLRDE